MTCSLTGIARNTETTGLEYPHQQLDSKPTILVPRSEHPAWSHNAVYMESMGIVSQSMFCGTLTPRDATPQKCFIVKQVWEILDNIIST